MNERELLKACQEYLLEHDHEFPDENPACVGCKLQERIATVLSAPAKQEQAEVGESEEYQGHGVTSRDLRRYLEQTGPDVIGNTACPTPKLSEAVLGIADHIAMDATEEAQQEAAVLRQAAALLTRLAEVQENMVLVPINALDRIMRDCEHGSRIWRECDDLLRAYRLSAAQSGKEGK